jgi:quercetin dioxygenase-like cupin family protein
MRLNDDLSARAVMHGAKMAWAKSPMPGVERRMLFRIGDEKARATSLVRYAPGSHFSPHDHPGGEEIMVLDGVFQDESGDYPAGSYIRNPPGSRHTPASEPGCLIFVKLWQFRKDDDAHVAIRPDTEIPGASWPGVASSQKLFGNGHEEVRLERWQPNAQIAIANPDGLELLVLDGGFAAGLEEFRRLSWLRLPPGEHFKADTGPAAARVFVKAGKLLQDNICEF